MNPTFVRLQVVPMSETSARVVVHGTAKEGLIKQRAGEKATRRIASLLNEAFS